MWALQGVCLLHRIAFAPALARQQFPPPHDLHAFQRAACALGLQCGLREAHARELASLPVPFVALLAPRTGAGNRTPGTAARLAIVVRSGEREIAWLDETGDGPATGAPERFAAEFAGSVLLLSRAAAAPADPDAPEEPTGAFGFHWFVPELMRHKSVWRDVLLASLAIQLMALATPLFTQIVIDKVIVHHTLATLAVIGAALAIFVVFTAVMSWVRQYLVLHTGNRIDAVLGSRVFEHLLRLPPRYFEHRPTGVLVARVQGVETIREFLAGAAVTLILDVPFLLIFLAIMFWYSVALTLVTLAVLVSIAALSVAATPLLRRRLNRQFLTGARNQAFVTEYVAGLETVKSLQLEPQLERRYGDHLAAYLQAGFQARQLANTCQVAAHGLEQVMTLAILCIGAWTVMTSREFTIGMLVAFQMFAGRLSQPMLHLVGLWQQFQQADIAVKRLGDVMNAPAEPYSLVPSRDAEEGRGLIEIRGLSFRHAPNLPYLFRSFNLDVEPGQCVAIMGPSGCGKSTFAKLLMGFYQPEDGSILIDGREARHLPANELRAHFGVVPQETVLFSGTVYENLVLANPYSGLEDVVRACRVAEIHDTIEALPEGYRTRIGEHGAGLSGGQKQRIAIARALLKRARILVFDEATSGLDDATAEQFARTINRLRGRVTMLFISHQIPRGLHVDAVITLGPHATRMSVVGGQSTLF
ncbi:MAG: peptidase domain-containing ABC transporter [Burkholderiales bacterium]|nr:peptidase domain-containing ABC transporter [Burkholderiales bacterium]